MAKLDIYRGDKFIRQQALSEAELLLIGRTTSCEIILPDFHRRISRHHAVLVRVPGTPTRHFVRDLGSLHGTKVNGAAVYQRFLNDEDAIEIADYRLQYSSHWVATSDFRHLRVASQKRDSEPAGSSTMTSMTSAVREQSHFSADKQELLAELRHRKLRGKALEDYAPEVMEAVLRVLGAEKGFIGLFQPGAASLYHEIGVINLGNNEEIEISDPGFADRLVAGEAIQDDNTILAPIQHGEEVSGFFCVSGKRGNGSFTQEDPVFLLTVGRLIRPTEQQRGQSAAAASTRPIEPWPVEIVGKNELIRQLHREIEQAAASRLNVLILGESGSGKELVARAIHQRSAQQPGPFIARNSSQATESLAESEIFGYAPKSGIAGADPQGSAGWFELANGGTLFLDEVHRLTPAMQDKFLRVLQDKQVWRIGARSPVQLDLNVVAATDEDLDRAMESGGFRQPFRYRFGATIHVPPLRRRKDDIPLLAFYFLDKYASSSGSSTRSITHRALRRLAGWDWPGNVRRLEQLIQLGVAKNEEVLFSWDFDLPEAGGAPSTSEDREFSTSMEDPTDPNLSVTIPKTMDEIEKEHIKEVLEVTHGNISKASQILGYKSRQTLLNKMDRFGIPRNYADPEANGTNL